MTAEALSVRCCIAGGGPAGMMLGLLLARADVDVLVLEKHPDFLRDFRGDTIHPSTLEVMHELGILDEFLDRPHEEARELDARIGGATMPFADFRHLPTHCRFIAFIPQWEFLDFLAEQAKRYPSFRLRMQAEAQELVETAGRVVGLRATTPAGPLDVRADLVVGADGRHSTVRAAAGLVAKQLGAPIDVLWFRLSRRSGDPEHSTAVFEAGAALVLINRNDYWQCGYVIQKGGFERLSTTGLDEFRRGVATIAPFFGDRVGELTEWNKISLLSVSVDRLTRWWRPGLLCLGDAAHAMSPIGGVGINLAIQDAVAAANELAAPLRDRRLDEASLQRLQRRRAFPTSATQRVQVFLQERFVARVLASKRGLAMPLPLRLLRRFPVLRRLTGRLVGMGFRPEHVRSPDAYFRGSKT